MRKLWKLAPALAVVAFLTAGCNTVSGTVTGKHIDPSGAKRYPYYMLDISTGDSVEVEPQTYKRYHVGDHFSAGCCEPEQNQPSNPYTKWSDRAGVARDNASSGSGSVVVPDNASIGITGD